MRQETRFRAKKAVAIFVMAFLCFGMPAAEAGSYTTKTTLLRNQEYERALQQSIRGARRGVIISAYLFKTSGSFNNLPGKIAADLVDAARRGLDVAVILERSNDSRDRLNDENHRTAGLLTKGGVKVYFDAPSVTSHLKAAVIDSRYVFIGSHNLTQSALKHNNELSVLIDSPELAAEIKAYLGRL